MKRKLYFVLSTHWDREWYQTFQNYRYQLVGLLDDILKGIEQKDLSGPFYTDGQVCLLEDYLEIKPQNSATIQKLVKESKLVSGPWYVLPDEFLISGESIIRNLRLGSKTVRQFGGEPSKVGFLCDMFGHISQMPQILAGFGIKSAILWRGIAASSRNTIWQGADGTKLPTYCFPYGNGYGCYALDVRNATKDTLKKFDADGFCKRLADFLKQEVANTKISPILIFDGLDHQTWDKQAYKQLFEYIKNSTDFELVHTSLDEYMDAMISQSDKITEVIGSELRNVADDINECGGHVIFGVASSRVDIKQANTDCQNMLCGWAEPFSLFSSIAANQEYPQGFLDTAWKWLILNHPHDSICGCSIDQVHKDMEYRFSQCMQITERVTRESIRNIGIHIDHKMEEDDLRIAIFNPLACDIDGVEKLSIQIPTDWPTFEEFFGFERLPSFRIYDADGNELAYQRLAQYCGKKNMLIVDAKSVFGYETTQVDVAVKLKIPAMGYTTLVARKVKQGHPVRHSSADILHHSGNTLENKFLKVSVSSGGTLNILDKQSGQCYENLLAFEDSADIGDGWFHGLAINDETFYSHSCPCNVSVVHNGPEIATMQIETIMTLPQEFTYSQMKRSSARENLKITTFITLTKDSQYLKVQTVVDNIVKDHRLRVVFPTLVNADSYLTDSIFDVVQRNIAIDKRNYLKRELETDAKPQQSWTAISDGKRGIAVISSGLYETAVSDEPKKPIKLTLFRSTRKTVFTEGEPNGQLQKQLTFNYLLMPLTGTIDRLRMFKEAQRLGYGIKTVQISKPEIDLLDNKGNLPANDGLLELSDAVLTSVSKFNDKVEVRFFNPTESKSDAVLKLSKQHFAQFKSACKVDNDGNSKDKPISITNGKVKIQLLPKEVITLELK